ncbi:MAG: outer membrane protein assembly factor BamA [Flavobacteriaceae bacterium]|nr:outer membrane protein assembly factor BamA [Flavobacteriaceae bacterium]
MNKFKICLFLLGFIFIRTAQAQETEAKEVNVQKDSVAPAVTDTIPKQQITLSPDLFKTSKTYLLGGVSVKGNQQFSDQSITVFSELQVGEPIKIPGDKLTSAIKKLWNSKLFSNVDAYVTKIDGETIYLEFEVKELAKLSSVEWRGIKKKKAADLQKETEFQKGARITENLLTTTKNYIEKKYIDKGYLKAKAAITTKIDTTDNNAEKALVVIDRGNKIKIKNLRFHGNKAFKNKRLKKLLKKTKQKSPLHVFTPSKYIEERYTEDLERMVEKYREKGYRDAQVLKDSISWNDDNTINLDIFLNEGNRYYFGDIGFLGNSVYSDEQLTAFLGLEKGDIYNGKLLNERVKGDGSPESEDITNTYLNSGYLFSQVIPVETKVENDTIDIEIRIREDDPATIRNIGVTGNEVTNDHVLYREIRTRPGQLFSRSNIIRTIRELGQLPYIDAENIVPDVRPNYGDKTVDIEYALAEKGSSQIELQGGFGGGTFVGTLGLSFNNFSIKNIFNGSEYKPVPRGDGQSVSLRAQASRFSSTYSVSFTEPWLGGKKPRSFSFSIFNSSQFSFNPLSRDVDRDQKLNILGATVGLSQRLKWPDDFFVLSTVLSYQRFDLNNFFLSTLQTSNGTSNNLSLAVNFGRNSAGPNPIFPVVGSQFNIGFKVTPPYSLISGEDFSEANQEEKIEMLEFYKINFSGKWYNAIAGSPGHQLVLLSSAEFGFLGAYNQDKGLSPFERFYLGGDGLGQGQFDGRQNIGLRGYPNSSLSVDPVTGVAVGSAIYNKFTFELRYPLTLKPAASIYALGFLEGGNTADSFTDFEPFKLKRSAGIGVRIFMPAFGLLGIDFGHGFDDIPSQPGVKSGWQTHFIIGQQF